MKNASAILLLCFTQIPLHAEQAAEPTPVKVFMVAHSQEDHGTQAYADAVRKKLATMPGYKLWTGAPKAFPDNGILIDIQGIDLRDKNDTVFGSALVASASVQSRTQPGYSRLLVENILELAPDGADVDDEAAQLLEDMDKRAPHTPPKAAAPPVKKKKAAAAPVKKK